LWEQIFSRFESKLCSEIREPQIIRLIKRRRREVKVNPKLGDQWNVPRLGGQWKVPRLGGQLKVPKLGGQWKVPRLGGQLKVPKLGGQWKGKKKTPFHFFPFFPQQFY
jgi:hypothetical protein